jgi:hypothetical protein
VSGQPAQARERAASAAQYVLLGGFAAVAAGISAQGLTGFARSNMELTGPWPYLLFLALDGAAGVCAVLLVRRATRAESGLAPRLAVCLRELRLRTLADQVGRKLSTLGWLHPAERIRVQLCMVTGEHVSPEEATRHVRVGHAARRIYRLRTALAAYGQPARPGALAKGRVHRAECRAHHALTRVGFADPTIAAAVLREVQVLTMTATLARLDYRTADAAQAAIANLIASPTTQRSAPGADAETAPLADGHPAGSVPEDTSDGNHDAELVAAASRIVARARQDGGHLSQVALGRELRKPGLHHRQQSAQLDFLRQRPHSMP